MRFTTNKQELFANYPTCYACDRPRTSMEHAPPQCFFPDDRDAKGNYLYRTNPIKVPSCDKHNTEKSNDDVYALWHLAALDGVNHFGNRIRENMLARVADHDWNRRRGALMKRLLSEISEFDAAGRPIGRCDARRMQTFLVGCARACYFHHTFSKLLLPLKVTNISNDFRDSTRTVSLQERESFFDSEMEDSNVLGSEPDIFNYSIRSKGDIVIVRLVFYGSLKHWIFYYPGLSYKYNF